MEKQIMGAFLLRKQVKIVHLFGHCSHQVPGLEIIGLGGSGRVLQEKLIFLTKAHGIRPPLRRITMGIDIGESQQEVRMADLSWLELPFLLLYWSLTKFLTIKSLDNCFAMGRVLVQGKIIYYPVTLQILNLAYQKIAVRLVYINYSGEIRSASFPCQVIRGQEILERTTYFVHEKFILGS